MEARAKQNAAANSSANDKSKPEPETRKPEAQTAERQVTDAVLHANNNAAHARNANDFARRTETGNVGCKMAVLGSSTSDLYARRPTSVISFSVPTPAAKLVDDQRAHVNDRKTSLAPFGVMSLT